MEEKQHDWETIRNDIERIKRKYDIGDIYIIIIKLKEHTKNELKRIFSELESGGEVATKDPIIKCIKCERKFRQSKLMNELGYCRICYKKWVLDL